MDIRQIERSLADLFTAHDEARRLVFWYDPQNDFSEDYAKLGLPTGVEKLTLGNTPFTVKHHLLVDAPETPFLLYAPFAQPDPQENWLLDLQEQGELFSADQAALLFRFYGFHDRSLEATLREYLPFFKAKKRRDALAALGLGREATAMDVQVGMMSVLAGHKVSDAELLVRTLLMQGLDETNNTLWLELGKFGLQAAFWLVAQQVLGVPEEADTLRDLFIRLALTHLQHDLDAPLPESLKRKTIQPATRAYVFVSSWLRHSEDREVWKEVSRLLAPDLGLETLARDLHPSAYVKVETFDTFDQALVQACITRLTSGTPEPELSTWLSARRPLFWYEDYGGAYAALAAGAELQALLSEHESSYRGTAPELFKRYAASLYHVDTLYRQYITLSDELDAETFGPLTDDLEKRYTFAFLDPLGSAWSDALEGLRGEWRFEGEKQWSFYRHHVATVLERSDREKVFVIISDAMRFEVAAELRTRLTKSLRGEGTLKAVQGVLPSITKLGMAALLPHSTLSVTAQGDVLVDGMSTKGRDERQKVLSATGVSSIVLSASDVLTMGDEGRQVIKPHRVIYIYQDQIDAAGDHRASERQVFAACERALEELEALVRRIVNRLNGTTVVVTSDHGFLYQRQALEQYDKVEKAGGEVLDSGRRHYLGRDLRAPAGTQTFNLPFLEGSLQAQSPRGTLRYAVQGGGAQYVHGGASLQEVCVPVLQYKHVRAERGDDGPSRKVNLKVSTTSRRITNTHFTVRLVQDEPVGERVRARQVLVKLVSDDGRDLSNAYPLNLDSAVKQASDREYIARLTVGPQAPQRGNAFLVILDAEDMLEILRESWQLSLAFTDDFGDF